MSNSVSVELPNSIKSIVHSLRTETSFKPSDIRKYILDAKVSPEDIKPWSDFDHPIADGYGRKMLYDGGNFEIMVMSWRPGDFAAIHDHGYTEWGAVQIFGPAEHATFRIEDDKLVTLRRWVFTPGDVVGVGHELIHQMGNNTKDTFFLSLHVYGVFDDIESVTGDARLFDLCKDEIQRINGGVFFALEPKDISSTEAGPKGDFPTTLRHKTELIKRLRRIETQKGKGENTELQKIIEDFYSKYQADSLLECVNDNIDENAHQNNSRFWNILNWELREAAALQSELNIERKTADTSYKYTKLYDELICQACLDSFMANYWKMFIEKHQIDLPASSLISIGCGTGLVERYLIDELGMKFENVYGIDISEEMVAEARHRIQTDVGNVLTLDPSVRLWDIAYSGLDVFQYLNAERFEEAIQKTASIVKEGGYFIGDFVSPDHIRWYPNIMYSKDKSIVSLRNPKLIEENGKVYQESEIININIKDEFDIAYSGKNKRFMPPLFRVRLFFEKAFGAEVTLYDAVSLEVIPEDADTCSSTRYVVVAKKTLA